MTFININCFLAVLVGIFFCPINSVDVALGVIANGTGRIERETFTRHTKTVMMVKHLIDTSEIYNIYNSVRDLDGDTTVHAIILVDYGISLLKIPRLLMTYNKALIKMGARTGTQQPMQIASSNTEELRYKTCDTDTEKGTVTLQDLYCLTFRNKTNIDSDDILLMMPGPRIIRSIVSHLHWTQVIIFYEGSTEMETSQVVDDLSRDGVLIMMFDVEKVRNLTDILRQIYSKKVEINKEIRVVTVCHSYNTRKILKLANEFDSKSNNKTLLKKFSKWLIVLHGYRPEDKAELHACASDLDNIAVIAIPEQLSINFEILCNGIDSILLNILKDETLNETHVDFKSLFIKKLMSWNRGTCQAFFIDTLLWTNKGREFSTVGHAEANGRLFVQTEIFPNAKYGYNKRRFLVSTLPYPPFVIKRKVNNTYIYEGFCMDLLNELAHKLNFTYDLTEPEDRKWGSVTNYVNLTFNGLVGQLQREEVDIVAAPISRQAEREAVMDSSYPYFYAYTTVLVRKPDVNATKWRTLVNPFKWEVLVMIGVSLVTVTILAFLLEKYNPFYDVPVHAKDRLMNGGLHTWHSSFWYIFGALLCQGGVHLPESNSGRTLISCWWLTCIIIVGTYCGNLIAFLTVTKERPPFNSLQEMLSLKGTYKWGTLGGTFWEMTIPNSSNPTYRAVGQAFLRFNQSDPSILHRSPAYHVNRVKNEKYAWIGDKTYIEISMAKECSLMKIKEEFMLLRYVIGFINNSPHTAAFSEQMIKIHEGGLFQIWKRKWWPQANFCSGDSIPEAKPISLLDVQSAFYVCLVGVFFGTLAFFIEIAAHRYKLFCMRRKEEIGVKLNGYTEDVGFRKSLKIGKRIIQTRL